MELEDSSVAVEDLGVQAQLAGSVMSADEIIAAVDKISAADVQAVSTDTLLFNSRNEIKLDFLHIEKCPQF